MLRRNRGISARVKAKKDVVQSKAISGKKLVIATIVILVALSAFGVKDAIGEGSNISSTEYHSKLVSQRKETRYYQKKADKWAHVRKKHDLHRRLPLTSSLDYEKYRTHFWKARANRQFILALAYMKEQEAIRLMWIKQDRDIHLALKGASARYGVSYSWLHACAHSEGLSDGRTYFVMNHEGSGAGGPLQFMESTFKSNVPNVDIPPQYKKWTSNVGQAYTAAYMFKIGQSRQWTGAGCN